MFLGYGVRPFCYREITMSFKRADRVSVLIQKALFEIFSRGLNDPRIGYISITSVNVTDDLRLARINYVSLGGQGNIDELKLGIESAKGFISRELAKRVKLKYTPKLEFFYDELISEAYEVIDKIDAHIEERNKRQQSETTQSIEDDQQKKTNQVLEQNQDIEMTTMMMDDFSETHSKEPTIGQNPTSDT